MRKVAIASKNKTKISAVKQAFGLFFPTEEFEFIEVSFSSGVCDPINNKETYEGALCRVEESSKATPADFWVGIESGVNMKDGECAVFSWIVIKSKEGVVGKARSATFYLPDKIADKMNEDKKIEDGEVAEEMVLRAGELNHRHGTVGILTDNLIDRTKYYVDPVILALIPFKNPDLY